MLKTELEGGISKLIKNLDKIPEEFWLELEHFPNERVIWFIDRQKPSIEPSYDFDLERFGLTKSGKIVWGFDSGCSCPTPWDDNEACYNLTTTWKEFIIHTEGQNTENITTFDEDWEDEAFDNLKDFLLLVNNNLDPERILKSKNSEVRRYLIKKIGYEKLKDKIKAKVIHKDGDYELLEFNNEKYVKVKDSSTAREYLLFVPNNILRCKEAVAWTFGLTENEYNPLIET